jgi:hypothetical protein
MTAVLRLYETVDALEIVRAWIDEHEEEIRAAGGELSPELAELLDKVELDLAVKAERVALYVRELIATGRAIREEQERLAARVHHVERAAESLKTYLKLQLERAGIPKIDGKLVVVRVQKNPPSLKCSMTPEDLWRHYGPESAASLVEQRITYHLRGRELLAAYRDGADLPPEFSIEQGTHLRIQ